MSSFPKGANAALNSTQNQKPQIEAKVPSSQQEKLIFFARKYTYVRESNGPNRSKEIDLWNKYTGASMGSPYCASFVSYIHKEAGIKGPLSAWSPDCVAKNNIKFSDVQHGDVFGMYFASKGRVAHTGFIDQIKGSMVYTVEANTSPTSSYGASSDRDGDGVFAKMRAKSLMGNSRNKYSRYWK